MTTILFFEKPGCAGNARQKALLRAAGHELICRDLLGTPWTTDTLLPFLAALPVQSWFNRSSPRVKRGEVNPERLDHDAAFALLLADPLLIRRPLMQRDDGARMVGFDLDEVERFAGLQTSHDPATSMEGCAATGKRQRCP